MGCRATNLVFGFGADGAAIVGSSTLLSSAKTHKRLAELSGKRNFIWPLSLLNPFDTAGVALPVAFADGNGK